MASGTIPHPTGGANITMYTPSENTTTDTITFAGNNERHMLAVVYAANALTGLYFVKTYSGGGTAYIAVSDASGITITNGSGDTARKMTFAHSSATITYVDFAFVGSPLNFS